MKQFLQGIKDGSPIGIGYFSVSFTFGLAAASSGLGWWEALLVSMMNMTSAGQFAGITVMAAAGSYLEMAVSQFVINLRYALMSISLSQKVESRFGAGKKLILGFANTDEIFAVAMSRAVILQVLHLCLIWAGQWGHWLGQSAGTYCRNRSATPLALPYTECLLLLLCRP